MNVIDFPTGTITHLTLQSKAADLYSRARHLSPAPAVLVCWSLLVRLARGQDRAQHSSALVVAHLVFVVRIVLGHVLGAHSTVQRCLLLLQLLEF